MLLAAEGVKVGEDGVALDFSGVTNAQMIGVGEHALYFLLHLVGAVFQVDAVAK